MRLQSSAERAGTPGRGWMKPLKRVIGGLPASKWTSLAPWTTAAFKISMSSGMCGSGLPLDARRLVIKLVERVKGPAFGGHQVHQEPAEVEHAPLIAPGARLVHA